MEVIHHSGLISVSTCEKVQKFALESGYRPICSG